MAKKEMNEDFLSGAKMSTDKKNTPKKAKKKSGNGINIPKKTATVIKSVVAVVVVLALLVAYVATGTVRKGYISSLGIPQKTLYAATITNGSQKARIKVGTYNFYFATTYNSLKAQASQYAQYGLDLESMGLGVDFDEKFSSQTYTDPESSETMSWDKHMQQLVLDSIEYTYTYYLAAVEANDGKEPEITYEQKSEIEETIKSYTTTANQNGDGDLAQRRRRAG